MDMARERERKTDLPLKMNIKPTTQLGNVIFNVHIKRIIMCLYAVACTVHILITLKLWSLFYRKMYWR